MSSNDEVAETTYELYEPMFDEREGRDVLTTLLKVTAGSTPSDNGLPADVASRYHTKLKYSLTECKRWNELLEINVDPAPPVQLPTEGDTDKLPIVRRRRYDFLVKNAEQSRRATAAFKFVEHDVGEPGETERKDPADSLFFPYVTPPALGAFKEIN